MTLSTFLSTPSIRLFCVESFSSTARKMTEVCSVSSFSICGMIDSCPFGCAVVDFDMNGAVMACTFKYRSIVEAVNGRLEWKAGRRVADFRLEKKSESCSTNP